MMHQKFSRRHDCRGPYQRLTIITGPVVRINPEELHILDLDFYDTIYAKESHKRDKWAFNAKSPDSHYATGFTLDHDLHKKRRDIIAPSFNNHKVQTVEPEIQERVDYLCGIIEDHLKLKSPVNMTVIILGLSMLTSILTSSSADYGICSN